MKRLALILLAFLLILTPLSGCSENVQGKSDNGNKQEQDGKNDINKISVVCTIFPQYDWFRQIAGEHADKFDMTLLINNRVDLHSYNPSVQDIAKIKTSDVFIYVGGHSDNWVENTLRDANADIITLNLVEIIGDMVIIDEHADCDDPDCEEDHDHDHSEPHEDEHIWLSLRNAKLVCAAIAGMLSEIDPENAQSYQNNLTAYTEKLSSLDAEYQAVADAADVAALVFADRFPFRYLVDDYGLSHYAAFHGCSAETAASFATIISLAARVNQLGLDTVMVTESSDQSVARTVIENTENKNQRILVLDSIQSVTSSDVRDGITYLSIMENNLNVLREALKRS